MVLKLEPMSKARVICLSAEVPAAIEALYQFGLIHVSRTRLGSPSAPMASFATISEHLIDLRAIEKAMAIKPAGFDGALIPLDTILVRSRAIRDDYADLLTCKQQSQALAAESYELASKLKVIAPLADSGVDALSIRPTASVAINYYELAAGARKDFDAALEGLFAQTLHSGSHCLVAIDPAQAAVFNNRTAKFARQIPIPPINEPTYSQEASVIRAKMAGIEAGLSELGKRASAIETRIAATISSTRAQLEEHAKLASLPNKFGRTESLEVIEGYVPTKSLPELQLKLASDLEGRVEFEVTNEPKDAPVILDNPPLVRRFEFLVRFFSLPSKGEYDPTLFIAITFPIIFGMILGDIAYGVLAMILAGTLYRGAKADFMKAISGMMFLSGFMTAVWGYVYGEFLGGEEMLGMHLHPIIERGGEGVPILMVSALCVGLIHLGFGLLVGFYTNWKHGHREHAYAKIAWLALEIGFLLLAITIFAPGIFSSTMAAVAIILVAVAGLGKFEGARGLVEIPGLISNILSYLRIMALGLSGVILAKLVNIIPLEHSFEAVTESIAHGDPLGIALAILPFLAFAIIFVLGHAVALGLGLFESGIQSLRLHYVEFFSKFYHGGGTAFVPLRDRLES